MKLHSDHSCLHCASIAYQLILTSGSPIPFPLPHPPLAQLFVADLINFPSRSTLPPPLPSAQRYSGSVRMVIATEDEGGRGQKVKVSPAIRYVSTLF